MLFIAFGPQRWNDAKLLSMRILPIRTISGRIVLGFFVLMATFGIVSGYTTAKMYQLGSNLSFIRTTYLEVALQVAMLQSLQGGVVDYLDDTTPRKRVIRQNRDVRRKLLEQCKRKLELLEVVPEPHLRAVLDMRAEVAKLLEEHSVNDALYEQAFATTSLPEVSKAALERLRKNEGRLLNSILRWFKYLKNSVEESTTQLQEDEEKARAGAIVLGAIAATVGLLVTIWAVLTLRPLRRLRDGARQVARGDYRERIEVVEDTEVAEVAREFNAMAAAIEEREQELVRSARLAAVGKMAALIAHEVRNPLSSIGLNADLLDEELGKMNSERAPEATTLCRAIHREVDRLAAITEEYLRFARLPRPKLEAEQVNEVLLDILEFQKSELAQAGISTALALDANLPLVQADEGQLKQALLNLIRNATDAMAAQGAGTLGLSTSFQPEKGVEIKVTDTGPGIPDEVIPHVFEPFFSTKERGTGLGLALTHQIITDHRGTIEIISSVGAGTSVLVRLPTSIASLPASTASLGPIG